MDRIYGHSLEEIKYALDYMYLHRPNWTKERILLRDHETCAPHEHVESNVEKWEHDQMNSLKDAALPPPDPSLMDRHIRP